MSDEPHPLRRILTVVAAYLAPSAPMSYGKMIELLREVPGFETVRYRDVYPVLFNSKLVAEPFDPDDPLCMYYDPEGGARELFPAPETAGVFAKCPKCGCEFGGLNAAMDLRDHVCPGAAAT